MSNDLLTIKQTASLLRVTDSVIKEMIKANVFETVKKGSTYKIRKDDVDEWLANLNDHELEQLALKRSVCRFSDYFKASNILFDFDADNKYEAIAEMSKKASELKIVRDHRWLYKIVVAREALVSTAIGKGVTLLHPRHFHPKKIKKPTIIFGRSKEEIEFNAIDNKPVNLYFLLLLHDDIQHLFSISYISRLLMHDDVLEVLRTETDPEIIRELLTKEVMNNK
ncbi:MAG: PTS sugar transporter subunit IIA [Candidatus Cloacimonetes bacterium]|nr:PTS sugar transporter subunit IIA [Candidatus Cloacimonadota bacterium]